MSQINQVSGDPSKNGQAVTSMIIGIVGLVSPVFFPIFFVIPFVGWILSIICDVVLIVGSIVGLILGVKGKKSQNRGMAIAGIVLCSIVLGLYVIAPIIFIVGMIFFGFSLFGGLMLTS